MGNEVRRLKAQIKQLRKILNKQSPSLEIMLKCRGFKIYKKEPLDDLLVYDKKLEDAFYNKLKKYSFRLFLRDVIKHQHYFTPETVARFATKEVTSHYIDFLLRNKIAELHAINSNLEREVENLQNSNNSWEKIMKEKIDNLLHEKERILEEMVKKKNIIYLFFKVL